MGLCQGEFGAVDEFDLRSVFSALLITSLWQHGWSFIPIVRKRRRRRRRMCSSSMDIGLGLWTITRYRTEVLSEGAWRRSGCLLEVCQRVSELGMQPKGFIVEI